MRSKRCSNQLSIAAGVCFAVCMLFAFDAFSATTTLRWCTSWRARYSDASTIGSGFEDWLRIPSGQNYVDVSAQFTQYKVFRWTGSYWVFDNKEGFLNYRDSSTGKYCTDQMTLTKGTQYLFRQYTQSRRDNRAVVVMSAGSTWLNPNVGYIGTVITVSDNTMERSTPTSTGQEISAMGVVRQLLALAPTLDWASDETDMIYINQDSNDCPLGSCYYTAAVADLNAGGGAYKHPICGPGGSAAIAKFLMAHELGHGLAVMRGGPVPSNYDGDVAGAFANQMTTAYAQFKDPPSYTVYNAARNTCRCQTGHSHCMQSREFIGSSEGESYANFVGTVLFNASAAESWFHYYKSIYDGPDPYPNDTRTNPWLRWDGTTKWMKNKCEPFAADFGGLGTEQDWGQFWWQLWATGNASQKFSFTDIHDVYRGRYIGGVLAGGTGWTVRCCTSTTSCGSVPDASGNCATGTKSPFGPLWNYRSAHPAGLSYLVESTEDIWGSGSTKYLRFTWLGNATGINY